MSRPRTCTRRGRRISGSSRAASFPKAIRVIMRRSTTPPAGAPSGIPTASRSSSSSAIPIPTRVRMRNGKFNNTLFTDIGGNTHFDESFPLFNWYVVESDTTRFRGTGVHVVNDAGGQVDGPTGTNCISATASHTGHCGNGNAGTNPYQGILTSTESFPLPSDLRVPGAFY